MNWIFKTLKLETKSLTFKFYADDGTLFFNIKGVYDFFTHYKYSLKQCIVDLLKGQNLFLSILNQNTLLRYSGIQFCYKKSSIIKFLGIWIKPYKSLGLELKVQESQLQQLYLRLLNYPYTYLLSGKTRGRGSNPLKGKRGTLGSNTLLNYKDNTTTTSYLNYQNLIERYRNYFGLIMSSLYQSKPSPEALTKVPVKASTFYRLLKFNRKIKKLEEFKTLNIYNAGIKINELFLKQNIGNCRDPNLEKHYPNLTRDLKLSWEIKPIISKLNGLRNPLTTNHSPSGEDLYHKYSELSLNSEEKKYLHKAFKAQSNLTSSTPVVPN